MFSSCEQETDFTEAKPMTTLLQKRSDNCNPLLNCDNLIQNGDFETCVCPDPDPATNQLEGIAQGNYPTWDCLRGTEDVVNSAWHWGMSGGGNAWWNTVTFDNSKVFMISSRGANDIEGIYQEVNLVSGNTYCFSVDVSCTDHRSAMNNNGNLTLHVMFLDEELEDIYCSFPNPNTYPECKTGAYCINIPVTNSNVYPNQVNFSETFTAGADYNFIYIWTSSTNIVVNNPVAEGTIVDDIWLTCVNEDYEGILADSLGSCEYEFAPDMTNYQDIAEIKWDFGDGNTSTLINPKHSYSESGEYLVTVNIKDIYGCCAMDSLLIDCEKGTTWHLCWSHNDPDINNMQMFNDDSYIGLRVETPTGITDHEYYPGGTDISYKHWQIFYRVRKTLDSIYHVPIANMEALSNDYGCEKGNQPLAQCYVLRDIPIDSIVNISMYGNGIMPVVEFVQ